MTVRPAPLIVASLLLAALTLLFPSSPTYDPWAWLVWGREVMHLDLSTVAGPSWKPLPVFFTAPFSLFGDAAPALWLVVARAGAIAAVVLAFAVARRLGGVVAGAAAAGGLVIAPWFVRNSALGNSEGLMAATVLAALERHLAGRPRQAFAWGVAAALLRPEAWPFLGVYALWLLWSQRGAVLKQVIAGIGCLPVLWFLPELWGSGNLSRAADRARQPLSNSAAFSDHPAIQVLHNAAQLMTIPAWIGVAALLALIVSRRAGRERALPLVGIAVIAVLWVAEVAFMTSHGFSGNQRYLIIPAVLALVVAAVGIGWALEPLAARGGLVLALVAGAAAILFALPSFERLGGLERELRYQGELGSHLSDAVADAGGAARLRACGTPYTGAFLVPSVAWQLGVHTSAVALAPRVPALVLRVRTTSSARPVPSLAGLGHARQRTLGSAPGWRIVGSPPC
jgi:hypothetical protein